MKRILLTIFAITAIKAQAQFFSFDATTYKTKLDAVGWGLDFNGGIQLAKGDKGNILVGIGSGIHMMDGSPAKVYAPIYAQAIYYKAINIINPYVNARIGYSIYDGPAKFIGKDQDVRGGLYANLRVGAGIRGYNGFSAIPFVGCSFMRFKYKSADGKVFYDKALFNAGLSFYFR
jgi:hypothetical protein